jgi:hypothetical protein
MPFLLRLQKALPLLFALVAVLSAGIYFFHNLGINPQYDNQGIWHAVDLITAHRQGKLSEFLLTTRKYPLFYILNYATIFGILVEVDRAQLFLIGRIVTFLYATGILLLLLRLSKRMGNGAAAAVLLLTSLLFIMFASAIRPHIPVAFWTLLSFYFAVQMQQKRTLWNTLGSFASALLAFCTLQSGLLAFLFPVWGMLGLRPKVIDMGKAAILLIVCLALAVPLGYPFLLGGFFGNEVAVGVDLGHDVGLTYGISQSIVVITGLLGSSPFIIGFALWGLTRLARRMDPLDPILVPMIAYVAIFCAVFLFHSVATTRFFLPVLPFLCLLGARGYRLSPGWLRSGSLLLVMAVFARFSWMSTLPDTYQQTTAFLQERPGLIAMIALPAYFFDIPTERLPAMEADIPAVKSIVLPHDQTDKLDGSWRLCKDFIASKSTDDIVLLWNDTPWAYYRVFEADSFGPNLAVYCKIES